MDNIEKVERHLNNLFGEVDLSAYPNRIIIPVVKMEKNSIYGKRYVQYRRQWHENPLTQHLSPFPLHIDIEACNSCNLRCPMCYRNAFQQDNKKMISEELFNKILDECVENEIPSIKFVGRGEVLIHPKIVDMVRQVKRRGIMDSHITSNAMLLTKDVSKGLIEAGIDNLVLSVDGVNKQTYESIRIGAVYEEVVKNILTLLELKARTGGNIPFIQVQMVCMKRTCSEAIEFVELWKSRGVNRIDLIRYKNAEGREDDLNRLSTKPTVRYPCRQLWQRLVVFADGTVSMCCGDYQPVNRLGNVKDMTIKEMWNGDLVSHVREYHKKHQWNEISPCDACEINAKSKDDSDWDWLMEDS